MEQLKNIEQCLIGSVQGQMGDLKKVNAKEMGEVIDMIKDLEEAMYYCSIIEAMEKTSEKEEHQQPMNISYYMEIVIVVALPIIMMDSLEILTANMLVQEM